MNPICKIQHFNFEPGEFVGNQQVDLRAAIELIEQFSWKTERAKHIQVELTGPSISFEYSQDCILKLAAYFNNKFVLYFYDGQDLYSKSLLDYKSAYPFIQYFFEEQAIDFTAFKKEITWLKQIKKHFITGDFFYSAKRKTIFDLLDFSTIVAFFMLMICLTALIKFFSGIGSHPVSNILFIAFVFIFLGGTNFILLVNYYLYSGHKALQLSRGSDTFLWGEEENMKLYRKADITNIMVKQNNAGRCMWQGYTVSLIYFKDGTRIKIPSSILSGDNIKYKFPDTTTYIKWTFIPFCKLDG